MKIILKYKLILFTFLVLITCNNEEKKKIEKISQTTLDSKMYAKVQAKEDSLRSTVYNFKHVEKLPQETELDSIVFFQRKIVLGYEVIDSIITYKNGKTFQNVLEHENVNDLLSVDRFQNPMQHLNVDNNKDIILKWALSGTIGDENEIYFFNKINNHFEKFNFSEKDCKLDVNLIYNKNKDFYISRGRYRGFHPFFYKFNFKNNKVNIIESLCPSDYDTLGIQYEYKKGSIDVKYLCRYDDEKNNFECEKKLAKLLKRFWKEYGVEEN